MWCCTRIQYICPLIYTTFLNWMSLAKYHLYNESVKDAFLLKFEQIRLTVTINL